MAKESNEGLTYAAAGVSIDAGERLIPRLKGLVAKTKRPEVIGNLGGFAGLFSLATLIKDMEEPVLVSCADGVGTKLKLAFQTGIHNTVGIDLVAMNVNDLAVTGAEPLFFLDYLATSKLVEDAAAGVVAGIAEGCAQAGCSLLGGETAEMPGMYTGDEYDLAGFCVGIADKPKLVDGSNPGDGDVLLGLASNGFHSNGYSLVRRVFLDHAGLDLEATLEGMDKSLGEALLAPTRIYVKPMRALAKTGMLKGAAHITGGGLVENPPRMLPKGLG